MKAIRVDQFGGPEVLGLQDVPDPVPAAGQVLVRIYAAGINPVETYIRSGHYAALPELPWTPGNDGAGVVEAVGADVDHIHPGERVYLAGSVSGTYAELAVAEAGQAHLLPDSVSFSQGAALGIPYATAYWALFQRGRAQPGETVLVHGATGSVGLAAIQLAAAAGMRVIASGGSIEGRELAAGQGADHVLDHHAEDHWQELMALTEGRGVDVILEMLANVNLGRDLGVVARGGRVVIIGSRGPVEINPRDVMMRDAEIVGMLLWNVSAADYVAIHAGVQQGLSNGSLKPVVAEEFPLVKAALGHEQVMRAGARGKIVLIP